eukprot:439359-Pyramimonas_sp.AAC.1
MPQSSGADAGSALARPRTALPNTGALAENTGLGVLEIDTNTKIGGVPSPREDDPDLGGGGNILASK